MRIKRLIFFVGFIFFSLNAKDKTNKTSIEKVIELYDLKICKSKLTNIVNDLAGDKKHKIYVLSSKGDKSLFNAFMLLKYNDRDTHIKLSAQADLKNKTCTANYSMAFSVDIPCVAAREEILRKFIFKGKLFKNIDVFVHKRNQKLQAVSSPTHHNTSCLITYLYQD